MDGLFDPKIPRLEGELTDFVESAVNASLGAGAKRVSGVLSSYHWQRSVVTSTGAEGSSEQSLIELSVRSFAEDDASGQGLSVSTTLDGFEPGKAGEDSGTFARSSLRPVQGKDGKSNVVFGPSIFANLLNSVGFSTSAFAVEAGFSFLGEKLGQKVGSEKLTLTDDRLRANGPGAAPFDDEGFPSGSHRLIDHGVFKMFVHDSRTAARFKESPTGNAVWDSDFGQIVPIPTCLVAEPGGMNKEELFEEAGDGLYVTNTWYTRFQNYRTGDFSTIPRDAMFRIENGKLAGPVKGVRVSDNLLRVLENIRGVSNERMWVRWWEVGLPTYLGHFLVDDVGVTRSTS